jgi:integrase
MSVSSPQRILGTPQLAFVRAWAEGIDPLIAWERFLPSDGGTDSRQARRELARLLEELKRLARLHGRSDLAALLSRDPEAMADKTAQRPSLDVFRQDFDEDFYSETELLALYEQTHGKPDSRSATRRRQRLRERLVLAIQWLQEKAARPPAPEDETTLWLDQRVAARLAAVGILRLSELHFWVRSHGLHWHRKVPRLGPQGAARISRWLRDHEATLGTLPAPSTPGLVARAGWGGDLPAQTGIVPLERFALPHDERSGAAGTNRGRFDRCKLGAAHDLDAIQSWLALRPASSHTWRAYRKEAERFLLWAVLERRKALSSLDAADCTAYCEFLKAPGPPWLGARNTQRCSEAWRPFEGPLGAQSRATAQAIVRALCAWLQRQRYLDVNPWDDVGVRSDVVPAVSLRALSAEQWALVQRWLRAQPPSPAAARLNFLMSFAYLSGLRLSELAAARLSWFGTGSGLRPGPGSTASWWIAVPALGSSASGGRRVLLPQAAMDALTAYLRARGLNAEVQNNPADLPLLCPLAQARQASPLGSARIYAILADAFRRCSMVVYRADKTSADRLRQASARWLRHTHAAHAAARGVCSSVLQSQLGLRSAAASAIYARAGSGEDGWGAPGGGTVPAPSTA